MLSYDKSEILVNRKKILSGYSVIHSFYKTRYIDDLRIEYSVVLYLRNIKRGLTFF